MHLLLLSLGDGAIERFVADTVGKSPRDTTIGHVSGAGRELFSDRGFRVVDFAEDPDAVDAVYVGGGNTFAIWHELRAAGTDRLLDRLIRGGLPYIGLSAGSVIAGPDIEPSGLLDDPAAAPGLESTTGFGWISDVPIPHAGGMLPAYPSALIDRTFAQFGDRFPLLALDDDQALVVHDDEQQVIASP
ncbi:Type 1 glutamine amidotransferase-like domain-containing protein [Gordonia sp. HY002]|uniref:Type 1 glutamine amidotransferase-like domain-containing protein n=1 Tax=Gordonia zhenghanii TaxID=2911516 RepID=UPI001EF0C8BF|nr:Type 1 glutamine amidotransferase-like domain-containing protein [Gordonia zhenghanii]MCF8569411.1 Type 1 glutamine amidotransferase-like domain-containing protein [Gordonia zhenghanii]MCF8603584.1 Type 1 glutamine amidotransferase-like domain-containing protein [Gordonia zhenghanii]